jgi:hypothetical protein
MSTYEDTEARELDQFNASRVEAHVPEKFVKMLRLEREVRTNWALAGFGSDMATRARGEKNYEITKNKLYALMDTFTDSEVQAFGRYRRDNFGLTV